MNVEALDFRLAGDSPARNLVLDKAPAGRGNGWRSRAGKRATSTLNDQWISNGETSRPAAHRRVDHNDVSLPDAVQDVQHLEVSHGRETGDNAQGLGKAPAGEDRERDRGRTVPRRDLEELVSVLMEKSKRVVISTSGWHYERIVELAKKFPKIGIRVSIEGLSEANDDLRGKRGGFDNGLKVLLKLREMGVTDIGFGITVSNKNSDDMLWLHRLAKELGLEFATATFHNSFYFHKDDNEVTNKDNVIGDFKELVERLLKENSPKSWYRAFFNLGLINFIRGGRRMLPCQAGTANFFVEPYGDIYPCNGLEDRIWKESMGNLRDFSTFEELWYSDQAQGSVTWCGFVRRTAG